MKKRNSLFCFFIILEFIFGLEMVSAIDISIDNYYPIPAEAGDYFNLWIKIINRGDTAIENAVVTFIPSYPFSLDPGENAQIPLNLEVGGSVTKGFKIRVDSGAKEGENQIRFQYRDCLGCGLEEKNMPITVVEAQTTFDVVLQELSSEGVFIAIANIGKNPANAVTIRIPEQEFFKTKLISASIVGNLESGDYTLVGFQITSKSELQTPLIKTRDQTKNRTLSTEEKELSIQIDYTDPLGIRRSVFKKILLNPASLTQISSSEMLNVKMNQKTSFWGSLLKNIWFWVSIILIFILMRKVIHRQLRRIKG